MLSPSGLELRVRGLHAQNRSATEAVAGQRVALNITGPRLSKDVVARGDWVLHPDIHAPTAAMDARITLLPDVPRAMRQDTQVHLHIGRRACDGAGIAAGSRSAGAGGGGDGSADTAAADRRVGAATGSSCATPVRPVRSAAAWSWIRFRPGAGDARHSGWHNSCALEAGDRAEALRGLLAVAPGWTDQLSFMRARNVRQADRAAQIAAVPAVAAGGLILSPEAYDRIRNAVSAALTAHHRSSPELPGLQPERLRLSLPDRPPAAGVCGIAGGVAAGRRGCPGWTVVPPARPSGLIVAAR